MKNAIVLLACVFLCAQCKQEEKPVVEPKPSLVTQDTSDQISADSASHAMDLYQNFRNEAISLLVANQKGAEKKYMAMGFALPSDEITKMAKRLETEGGSPVVYAMLGIRYDSLNQPYVTLIFQEKTSAVDNWTYYDYSRPCPPNCPTDK